MCPHEKMQRKRGHMPWLIFTKMIDDCAASQGRGLEFFLHKDGEPLMDPLLFRRIAYITETLPGSRAHFNTNAMLLDDDAARDILASPLHSLTFSVDGASRET